MRLNWTRAGPPIAGVVRPTRPRSNFPSYAIANSSWKLTFSCTFKPNSHGMSICLSMAYPWRYPFGHPLRAHQFFVHRYPPNIRQQRPLSITFRAAQTQRPADLGINDDRRWLGIAVNWVEFY